MPLRALASVNLAAIERNVARLCGVLSGSARLCAVVKADGYGHGAAPAARAALAGGAAWLAVATAQEAAELRAAGIGARILVMGALSSEELPVALGARADLVAWDGRFVERVQAAARERLAAAARERLAAAAREPVRLHVKLDTGMGRLGTRSVSDALGVAERIAAGRPALVLAGAMTHFATSEQDPEFLVHQLAAFEPFAQAVRARCPDAVIHAANSGAVLNAPGSHFDLVRCGIAVYGCDPMNEDPAMHGLEPALELTSYVAAVKLARAGDSVGYGRRFIAERDTFIATLPIGYADGVRRAFTDNCEVLIGGERRPLVGTVSMDNITIDLGPGRGSAPGRPPVEPGTEAVLIGADGGERQTAEQLARRIGTINYEILCGISPRVPRRYHRDGEPLPR